MMATCGGSSLSSRSASARSSPFRLARRSSSSTTPRTPSTPLPATESAPRLEGGCTLRAAIIESNQLPGADEILIPAGTYVLTTSGTPEDDALAGDLDVRDDVEIRGSGAASTVIDAAGAEAVITVFARSTDFGMPTEMFVVDLTLSGAEQDGLVHFVTTSGGRVDVRVSDCIIERNSSDGIFIVSQNEPALHVERTSIRDNGGYGIFIRAYTPFVVENSQIARNGAGIGIVPAGYGGESVVRQTVIEDNFGVGSPFRTLALRSRTRLYGATAQEPTRPRPRFR